MHDRQLTHLTKVQRANRSRRSSVEAMVRGYHVHAYKDKMALLFSPKNCYAKGKLAAESMKCSWHVKSLRRMACHDWRKKNCENIVAKICPHKNFPLYGTEFILNRLHHRVWGTCTLQNNDVDIALERFSEHVLAA